MKHKSYIYQVYESALLKVGVLLLNSASIQAPRQRMAPKQWHRAHQNLSRWKKKK